MALTKIRVIDKVEIVTEYKHLQVRFANKILEDGNLISTSHERTTIHCNEFDSADANGVRAIADAVWTDDVLASWETYNAELQASQEQ